MSNLTELIAEGLEPHTHIATTGAVFGARSERSLLGRHCCECGHILPRVPRGPELAAAVRRHHADITAAVVADWLESDDTIRAAEDAHPERGGSCCFNIGQPGHRCPPCVTSASMSAALAAEARKGAGQ